jgi:hypothetical protein
MMLEDRLPKKRQGTVRNGTGTIGCIEQGPKLAERVELAKNSHVAVRELLNGRFNDRFAFSAVHDENLPAAIIAPS